jgi:ligand-binding sensor domain-containing protein/serine phosphatase RsbU (regulator of sigma subunit)
MRPNRKIKFSLLLYFAIVTHAIAQQYMVENFANQHLLAESYVYTFVQDTGAYLWIGTSDGLFRFDGTNLKLYTTADSLADNFITCSFKCKSGIWFGHMNGSMSFFDGRKFTKIQPSVVDKSSITEISGNNDGSVWAGTFSGGLIKFKDDFDYELFSFPAEGFTLYSFRFITKNTFLAGSADGLKYCRIEESGKITILRQFTEVPKEPVRSIIKDIGSDGYFIATDNQGIYHLTLNNKTFVVSRIDNQLQETLSEIQCIVEDNKQNLWISTFGKGLYRLSLNKQGLAGKLFRFDQNSGLSANNIKTLFCDRDENVWTGNFGKGISRLSARTITTEIFDKDNFGQNVNCIVSDNKYRWIGTEKGLLKTELDNPNQIEFYSANTEFKGSEITSIYIQNSQFLWIGTNNNGIFQFSIAGKKFTRFPLHDGILENSIISVTGYDQHLWVGTKKGACDIDLSNNEKTWYTINQSGLPHNAIKQIYTDSKKQTWIVTLSSSLTLIQKGKLKKINIPSSSAIITLESITEDLHGNIWLGSGGQGIFLLQSDSIMNFTTKQGLFSDYCYSIIGDKQGFVWTGHRGGLSRINCTDFSIKAIAKNVNNNNRPDFNPNSVDCDRDGKIYFGYNGGLLCNNPEFENTRFLSPALHITAININNQEVEIQKKIKLYSGRYKIRFDFIGISLKEPESVRYQYRLKGYDNDWSEISQNTSATYPGLTEGIYVFEVNAASGDGITTPVPERIEIVIKTSIWKSLWFYIVVFLVVVSLIFFYNKQLQHKHIAEKLILEQRVLERTLEIQRQKDEIEQQRDLINKKNIDITDSLKYARKIQSSINPPDELLDKLLPDHFLINKPKDIVSGDFCWYTQTNDKIIVTVADCTGHGVPGAMMSILGINSLNEIIINYGITEPSRVLEFLRLKVITSLSQHSKDSPSFDGINLGLCVIDQKTMSVQFSGAINNMVHIQDGVLNLIRADRIPIGVSDLEHKPFTDNEFQGKKGDVLYLFSDGFQDQFGGEREKKFSSKRFIDLLFSLHHKPIPEQKKELENTLSNWMGDNEQTDDITILGFRL